MSKVRPLSLFDKAQSHKIIVAFILDSTASWIPEEIILLLSRYYDGSMYLDLDEQDIKKLINLKKKAYMNGNTTFLVQGLRLELRLKANSNGHIQFQLRVNAFPLTTRKVTALVTLYCTTTRYEHRSTAVFIKKGDSVKWASRNMSVDDCKKYSSLQFACSFEVLYIEYATYHATFFQKIAMAQKTEYQWKLDGDRLMRLQQSNFGQHFYSDSFGSDCWCIAISPNGWIASNKDCCIFQLKLAKLPFGVKAITVALSMNIYAGSDNLDMIFEWKKEQYFDLNTNYKSGWPNLRQHRNKINTSDFKKQKAINCVVTIQIQKVWDQRNDQVPGSHWDKFGVICK